jgi:hypothetical protein
MSEPRLETGNYIIWLKKLREFVRRNVGTRIQDNGFTPRKTRISFTWFLSSARESPQSEALWNIT